MNEKLAEDIIEAIIDGATDTVICKVKEALEKNMLPSDILNNALIPGMNEVGLLFKEGEMFVPEVLVSSKAMQAGIDIIKPMLVSGDVKSIGKILTATVEGDLHDIGVKLCGLMLEGAGFEVYNIGVDKPAREIVNMVKEIKPNILGLSAMLTTTMTNMKDVIDMLKEEGLFDGVKIMVGGAPISPSFAQKIGAFYSTDASDCVNVAKSLIAANV